MRIALGTFFIVFFCIALAIPTFAHAETDAEIQAKIEDVKRQRDSLLEEQRRLQASLDETSKQGTTLQTNVKSLDVTRAKLANDLKITQTNINSANLTIQKLENDIGKNETEISNHEVAIKSLLKKLASYDRSSIVIDVLTHKNLNEVWADTVNIWNVEDSLILRVDSLRNTQVSLLKNKVAKESQKTKLVGLSSQLKGQKTVADDTRSAQALLLAATKSKEAEYQKMLAENIAQQKKFEEDLFKYESQLRLSIDPGSIPPPSHGLLTWPLPKITITQYFGYTPTAALLYKTTAKHGGTDFRASVGTPVKASLGGVVTDLESSRAKAGCQYGYWVIIDHQNGLSTLYAHLSSVLVSKGQELSAGDMVGYSGYTGYTYPYGIQGAHLHFGLYISEGIRVVYTDTLGTSSTNCKGIRTVVAPQAAYLDPLAYLPNL